MPIFQKKSDIQEFLDFNLTLFDIFSKVYKISWHYFLKSDTKLEKKYLREAFNTKGQIHKYIRSIFPMLRNWHIFFFLILTLALGKLTYFLQNNGNINVNILIKLE